MKIKTKLIGLNVTVNNRPLKIGDKILKNKVRKY